MFADKILINKIDLLAEGEERENAVAIVKEAISRVNTQAEIQVTHYSKVDLDDLIGVVRNRVNVEMLNSQEYMTKTHTLQHQIVD